MLLFKTLFSASLSCLLALLIDPIAANLRHSKLAARANHHNSSHYTANDTDPSIVAPGSASRGWRSMPDLTSLAGANLDTTSLLVGDQGATLTHYITSTYTASQIKRAIIIVHGEDRQSWNMQLYVTKALERATLGGSVQTDEVVVMAPQFFNMDDAGAFPADSNDDPTTNQMIWSASNNGWGQGFQSSNPSKSNYGSFDALDSALAFFHNTTRFPSLNKVVLAGFSMGGQLVQRYSVFRNDISEDSRTRYLASSAASFVYLNSSRPTSTSSLSSCSGYDDYKYGLSGSLPAYLLKGTGKLINDVSLLQQRYVNRSLSFMVGLNDHLSSDLSCSANVQGDNHIDRIYNWINYVLPYLSGSNGSLSRNTTVDYVVGSSHDAFTIINSDPGIQRFFLDAYNGPNQDANPPPSNGYKSGQPTPKDLRGSTDSALRLFTSSALYFLLLASILAQTLMSI